MSDLVRRANALRLAAVAVATLGLLIVAPVAGAEYKPPPIKHVWVINLENEDASATFGADGRKLAPYLSKTLPHMGALVKNYYGIGHASLDNYIAEISGQAPDTTTDSDCLSYIPFTHLGSPTLNQDGQLTGQGCVFPTYVPTIASQLQAHHLTWRAYNQDMGIEPTRDGTVSTNLGPACGHPTLGGVDESTVTTPADDSYTTRHNPFMYFDAIVQNKALCDSHVLSLPPIVKDLKRVSTTPNYSMITPNSCADGHDIPCHDGSPGGLPAMNTFLKQWIPKLTSSPAYKADGLIVIVFDEALISDGSACCGETASRNPSHPNIAKPGLDGPGGGKTGAVLLSKFIKPGTVSTKPYNHYSQLRSIEDIFGLKHIGDAQLRQVKPFGPDIYTKPRG